MEVLRLPRSTTVEATIDDLTPDEAVVISLTNLLTLEVYDPISGTVDADGVLTFELPAEFVTHDGFLLCEINNDTETVYSDNIDVVRPYVDIVAAANGLKCTEEQATQYERVARYIIDAKTGGFKFMRKVKSMEGYGNDYLPVDEKIWSIESVFENGELVWDTIGTWEEEYAVATDHTAVVVINDENREAYRPVWRDRYSLPDFPSGWDYEVTGEFGYKVIPHDIKEATSLLMDDIACGNLKFWNKYVSQYKTDAFDIKYDRFKFDESTGNMMVDTLIDKYKGHVLPRML